MINAEKKINKIKYIKIEGDKGRCPRKLIGVSENGTYFLSMGENSIEANPWYHVQDYPFSAEIRKLKDNQQIDLTAITEDTWETDVEFAKDEEGNSKTKNVTPKYAEGKYGQLREVFDRILNGEIIESCNF